ncbi:MAG: leucine-rich repeat protein [Clostridia bacterium]|nr:leucine-rich repeat protein [Clostridia bacterium]
MKKRQMWVTLAIILTVLICAGLCTVLILHREHLLDEHWQEALQEIQDHRGEYDERSIVLYDTNPGEAQALAKKFNAKLRISSDGKFATLTLEGDVTVEDIYAARGNRKYISEMALDYQVKTSELTDAEEMPSDERLPTQPQYSVTDSDYALQSYLDYLNMGKVWERTQGSHITVAVIDTGIDTDHPEFEGRISEYSYNATEDKIVKDHLLWNGSPDWSLVEDEQGHGTAVTGVIAASMNSEHVVGIAPQVTILVIKAECDENGTFARASDLIFGLYYAIERDAAVVNMSFGAQSEQNIFAQATRLAYDSDVICVAATGNKATAELTYPAADAHVFGIGALTTKGWTLADYSNYGENVDLVAPGTTYTTLMGGTYGTKVGTSLAAPCVTGAIALYLSVNPHQEFRTVEEVLYASCYDLGDLGRDWYYGYGALDVSALILEERGTVTFHMMSDELENTEQLFIRNHTLQNIPEPERLYAIFDGWYYDPQCTDEYDWYADRLLTDLTLYAKWVNESDGIPFTYVELDDGTIEICSYTGHRRYITIPDTIDGKVVSSIGEEAFKGQTRLREVILPQQLKYIKRSAFDGCNHLEHIEIPDTVESIGDTAFFDNVSLSYVTLGSNSMLVSIGVQSFANCTRLTRFELPAQLTQMDGSAFCGATNLTALTVGRSNSAFVSKDGVLFNDTGSTLICCPAGLGGEYSIPDHVMHIGDYAFCYTKLSQIDLSHVQSIGQYAFAHSALEDVVIPDSVHAMGIGAFANSQYLKSAVLGNGLTTISMKAFFACFMLREIEIPAGIRSIESNAFFNTTALTNVHFSANGQLTLIEEFAFSGSGLQEIVIPSSVIRLDQYALANTPLSSVTFEEGSRLRTLGIGVFEGDIFVTEIALPDQLTEIGAYAFKQTGLQTVTIPTSVTHLDEGVFASCYDLTDISVEDENTVYTDVDGVVYDKALTAILSYPAGNARTDYAVQNGITVIGKGAFYGSHNLTAVTLPTTLQEIRSKAFYHCSNLQSMQIPDNVLQISNHAFANNQALTSITFTENSKLPRISYESFAYCGLTSFRVPASVSTVAQGAFKGCVDLTSITFAANSKLESVPAYMLDGCDSLQHITFEKGSALTAIQAHGFEGMRALTSIDFGNARLTQVDNYAFRFCESLTRIDLPEGVRSVGRYAFCYCSNLSEVALPASIEEVSRFAFLGTKGLNVYFAAETLPIRLEEDWDHGIAGYYLGVTDVITEGDWKYAKLVGGDIAIIAYSGHATELDLTTLNFGGKIVNIGGQAFAYSTVERIVLPETLINIQNKAFYRSNLQSAIIPANVRFIGRAAFADTPIISLIFAGDSSLEVMEQSAFEGTVQLATVTLPRSLTTLGRAAFKSSGISSLTFADGITITKIPEEAFAYTNITFLALPDSVTVIDHNAFRETTALKAVKFGNGDEMMIMNSAFYRSGLEALTIPANVTYLGEYTFTALSNLQAFAVDEKNPNYKAVDGLLLSKDDRKLIAAPAGKAGRLTIPTRIEVIGAGAFEESKLTRIEFPADTNILSFGCRAFYAADITEMYVPASVVAIDYYAFAMCESLTKVTFAEGNQLRGVYEGAFYGCKKLSDITLPDAIVEISDFAFYGCQSLDRLPISQTSTLRGIYDYAFAYARLDGALTAPESLTEIGAYAFMGNDFSSVTIPATNAMDLFIGIGAFVDCNSIEHITVPFIGATFEDPDISWFGYIFGAGGYQANAAYVPQNLKRVTISDGISEIGRGAFYQLTMLEQIDLPHSVTLVHVLAFHETTATFELTNTILTGNFEGGTEEAFVSREHFGTGLTGHLTLNEGVESIASGAFSGYVGLTGITLPSSIKHIGDSAFFGCTELSEITLPKGLQTIGNAAFAGCTKLVSITIPASVTDIGGNICWGEGYIFDGYISAGCDNLERIIVEDGNTDYMSMDGILYDLSTMEILLIPAKLSGNVTIPEGVTTIAQNAFMDHTGLTEVSLPTSLTSVGWNAFTNCTALKSIVIPDGVTSIEGYAFSGCTALQSVILPARLTRISQSTFMDCIHLQGVILPESVTVIEDSAFSGCHGLTKVNLPQNLTEIRPYAFFYCDLTSITLPGKLTLLGSSAFAGCNVRILHNNSDIIFDSKYLLDIGLLATIKTIYDKNGDVVFSPDSSNLIQTEDGFLFEKYAGEYKLIAYLGEDEVVTLPTDIFGQPYQAELSGVAHVVIPEGMTEICDYMFEASALKTITIPEGVTRIGEMAFYGCENLELVTIPASVTDIGENAFGNCPLLCLAVDECSEVFTLIDGVLYNKNVTEIIFIEKALTSVCIPSTVINLGQGFRNHTKLQTVSFEQGSVMTELSDFAFNGCTALSSVILPESMEKIGSYAFYGCTSLSTVALPEGLTTIGDWAFSDCIALEEIILPKSLTTIKERAFYRCISLKSIVIPESATNIGEYAFYNCHALTSATLPSTIKTISKGMFMYCRELISITIPESVTNIGSHAFYDCNMLTNLEIPAGVTSIGQSAFAYCWSLKRILLPDGITVIEDSSFDSCSSLQEIKLPQGITSIGKSAFEGCQGLMSVAIPEGVTSIGTRAFAKCVGLTSIRIPATVTSIGEDVFHHCDQLSHIEVGENNSHYVFVNGVLYDTASMQVVTLLHLFSGTLLISNDMTEINRYTFEEYPNITAFAVDENHPLYTVVDGILYNKEKTEIIAVPLSIVGPVTIPDSVTHLPEYAFYNCRSLTAVILPDTLTEIGRDAFFNCYSLTKITIPDSVTAIGESAFLECRALRSIVIPDGVTELAKNTFAGCTNLVDVVIGNGVTSIGDYAFDFCSNISCLTIGSSVTSIGNNVINGGSISLIYNNSDLQILPGASDNSGIAKYADLVIDKNGNLIHRSPSSELCYIDTPDGFRFKKDRQYSLVAYLGDEETVTLPSNFNGKSYGIESLSGIRHLIIPEGVTYIDYAAFKNCQILESVVIPGSVKEISNSAFESCPNLKTVTICDGVTYIGNQAFAFCSSLTSISIPDSVTFVGSNVFRFSALYEEERNWQDGTLIIDGGLVKLADDTVYFTNRDTRFVVEDALEGCYQLKHMALSSTQLYALDRPTNVETVVLTKIEQSKVLDFGESILLTLKNIVIANGAHVSASTFQNVTDTNIYVEADEKDVRWDENFPNWSNGNSVIYGEDWIFTNFYRADGTVLTSQIYQTAQVIRQPYLPLTRGEQYSDMLIGWDLNGDGFADTVPATSTVDISAYAIVETRLTTYRVTFCSEDGMTILLSTELPYGSEIAPPQIADKLGYTCNGWLGYRNGMKVSGNHVFVLDLVHNGEGHVYGMTEQISATCTEQGYSKHVCTVCGEWYATDFVAPLEHSMHRDIVNATCTKEGTVTYTCTTCGDVCTELLPALGHAYTVQTVRQATCTERGEMLYTCAKCGNTKTEYSTVCAHDYQQKTAEGEWFVWLTENVSDLFFGYKDSNPYYFECADCQHIQTMKETALSGNAAIQEVCDHSLGEWIKLTDTACLIAETEGRICSICNEVIEARVVGKAVNHRFGEWHETEAPSCTQQGKESRNCTVCGKHEERLFDALGHDYSTEWTEDLAPTCTTAGSKSHHCIRCDSYKDITEISFNGHSFGDWAEYNKNQHKRECFCGEVQLADHIYDHDTDASCNECGAIRTADTSPANGSDPDPDPPKKGCKSSISIGVSILLWMVLMCCAILRKREY